MSDQLEVIGPNGEIEFHTLDPDKGVLNIGRHPDNDIVLDSPTVALFHAVLDYSQRPYHVTLLSPEGEAAIAGERLRHNAPAELQPWDTLEVGGYTLIPVEGVPDTPETPSRLPATVPPSAPVPLPIAADQVDEVIVVELAEREATVDVEQTAVYGLTIANGGDIVAGFEVRVEGVDERWVVIAPPQVNLNEGERAVVTISITPPRQPTSRAGTHRLAVVVTSPNYPGRISRLSATLTINPYYEFVTGELSPRQQTVGGRHPVGETVLQIANRGNSAATFRLEAMDDERACSFEFQVPGESSSLARQAEVRLPPEETYAIPIRITPLSPPLVGLRSQTHSFTVTASVVEGPLTPRSLLGQIRVRPLIGAGLLFVLALLLVLLVIYVFWPRISYFRVSPDNILAGEPVTLSWKTSFLTSNLRVKAGSDLLVLDKPEDQVVLQPGDRLYPQEDQTYYLQADTLLSEMLAFIPTAIADADITVGAVYPEITFSVDKTAIVLGESVTLRWEVLNADGATLYINKVPRTLRSSEFVGEQTETPVQAGTYVYEMEATNRYGVRNAEPLQVVVSEPTPTPLPVPVIQRFTVSPLSVTSGQTVTIQWEVSQATKVRLSSSNTGWNQEYASLSGMEIQQPPASTNYVLTAIYEADGRSESRESSIIVQVNPKPTPTPEPQMPVIDDFRVVPNTVVQGDADTVQLVWAVSGETTNIEISGPTLNTVSNLDSTGSIPVPVGATTFFILTAYNGDLNTSKTVELTVNEPTPTPVPTATPSPTPTPAPDPEIEYFVAQGADDPNDVTLLGSGTVSDSLRYEVVAGARVQLSWSVQNVPQVTILENGVSLGEQPAVWDLPPRVVMAATQYQLTAVNDNGVEADAYIQITIRYPEPPPAPYNVGGPALPADPLVVTWDYDPTHINDIVGFRVYRASSPYESFIRVADEASLDNMTRQWEEPDPQCGMAYYVVAVYEVYDNNGQKTPLESDPSPDRYYSWPCPTPTP